MLTWPPPYKIRKHRRARSVKLRASKKNGLEVTVPYRFSLHEVPEIVDKHREWITKQLLKIAAQTSDELPDVIHFKCTQETYQIQYLASDKKLALFVRPTKEIVLFGNMSDKTLIKRKLLLWVKEEAKRNLIPMLAALSQELRLPFYEAGVRDQQTLWGSCTRDKRISLNYKLIFLPTALARHVMIHELCHTKHLNHSEKFWQLVAAFDPACENHKRILRRADELIPTWI